MREWTWALQKHGLHWEPTNDAEIHLNFLNPQICLGCVESSNGDWLNSFFSTCNLFDMDFLMVTWQVTWNTLLILLLRLWQCLTSSEWLDKGCALIPSITCVARTTATRNFITSCPLMPKSCFSKACLLKVRSVSVLLSTAKIFWKFWAIATWRFPSTLLNFDR